MKKNILFLSLMILLSIPAGASEINDLQLHLKITGLDRAAPPEMWRGYLILTYKPAGSARYVGASFSNEDYQRVHTFMVNSKGIYFLILPEPTEETLDYRLVVDGIWRTDPRNPKVVLDRNGIRLSRLELPAAESAGTMSPFLMEDDRVRFHIRSAPGKQVYLAGDFNRWDPYMTSLPEAEPGLYAVTLPLKPGRYGYYFLIDGEPVTDPLNFQKTTTSAGEAVSILYIPG